MELDRVYCGDARQVLATWPDQCVDMVVTSPPYYGLRDYGTEPQIWSGDPECVHEWDQYVVPAANGITHDGGMSGETLSSNSATRKPKLSDFCSKCGAWRGSYGLEPTPELYVEHTVMIFREIHRVLKDHGTIWLNIGDSYAGSGGVGNQRDDANKGNMPHFKNPNSMEICKSKRNSKRWGGGNLPATDGLKPKDLIGIPWMLAFALRADGWYLRQDIIWEKPNPMPESVTDRCTKSHEYIFLLSKCQHYYYDAEAIKEPVTESTVVRLSEPNLENQYGSDRVPGKTNGPIKPAGNKVSRNHRSVWQITTKPYKEAHFATFPPELPETCILAGSSAKGVCPKCGKPWKRMLERVGEIKRRWSSNDTPTEVDNLRKDNGRDSQSVYSTTGWQPTCGCWEYAKDLPIIDGVGFKQPLEPVPAVILDPFMGSGTVASVTLSLKRHFLGIELNPKYITLCEKRIRNTVVPLFVDA